MKPFLRLLLAGLLAGCTYPAPAQVRYDEAKAHYDSLARTHMPRVILKLAPLTMFELQNTFEVGAEVRLTDWVSVQGQIGYAPNALLWRSLPDRYTRRENWRGRLEIRWYTGRRYRDGFFPIGQYVGLDLLYKQLNAYEATTVGRECQGFGCAYYQKINDPVVRYIGAVNLKIGSQRVIGYRGNTQQPLWLLDGYVGFGIRYGTTERTIGPADQLRFESGGGFGTIDPFRQENRAFYNPVAGLKVGYVLK
jgi:hypothetical protein